MSRAIARRTMLVDLARAGRESSEATVLWHAAIAERAGVHITDYKTLGWLQRYGPSSAGAIGEMTGLTSASVSALIDRLEARTFVRRTRDPADGRRVLVETTPQTLATFGPYFDDPDLSQADLYEPYSVAELKVILDFLTRNTARLRRAHQRIRAAR